MFSVFFCVILDGMDNVVKFKKPFQFRIGGIVFGVLCIYLLVLIISFFTKKNVASYEVVTGDLSSYYSFQALAIRKEKIITAPRDGYITYFTKEDTKASAKSVVYAMHDTGNLYQDLKNSLKEKEAVLSEERRTEVLSMLDEFSYAYRDDAFYETASFKESLNGKLLEALAEKGGQASFLPGMAAYYAFQPGIVLYEEDGLENLTINNFSAAQVSGTNYTKKILKTQESVQAGDDIYKLITDETWYLVAPLEDSLKKHLEGQEYVDIEFQADNRSMSVPYTIVKRQGQTFLCMECTTGLIRYAKERYVSIDIVVNQTKGFKIPNSSIVKLPFLAIPKDAIMESKNKKGVMHIVKDEDGNERAEFVETALYASDENFYYTRSKKLKQGDQIQLAGSANKDTLARTKNFPCVYCMNKGYAVVKIVEILEKNDDYSITEMNTAYGIRNYDHIVLDGTLVKEGEMIP